MTKRDITVDIHPGQHVVQTLRTFGSHPFIFVEIAAFGLIPTAGTYLISGSWTGTIVFQIPFLVAQQVIYAALVYAAASFAGVTLISAPDVLGAYRIALGRIRDLVEVFVRQLGAALLLIVTVIGIPWAIRLLIRWYFAVHAVVLNDLDAKCAITFSCDLVTGRAWQIFGLIIATLAPGAIIAIIFLFIIHEPLLYLGYSALFTLVLSPLTATFWTLLFLELRAAHPDYQSEILCAT